MLQLNALIEQNSPEVIEQQLIKQYLEFAKKNGAAQHAAHQSLIWVLKLMRFHNGAHPGDLNQHDIESYLSALVTEQHVSNATQQLALSAISSFYQEFMNIEFQFKHFIKNKTRRGFSDRFSASICQSIIQNLKGPSQLMAKLAYHCQLRLSQVAKLKLSDIDLKSGTLSIFDNNNTLKFKAVIPLSLQLDLRIQKMRANQLSKQLNRQITNHSLFCSTKGSPTQIGLFNEKNCLLFILSDIKDVSNLDKRNQINSESQLAILKSEIKVILNRTKLFSLENKKTVANLTLSQHQPISISRQTVKPTLFKLAKNIRTKSKPINNHTALQSPYSFKPMVNQQKDFFDLGAA